LRGVAVVRRHEGSGVIGLGSLRRRRPSPPRCP
jgi:hypothetical protein